MTGTRELALRSLYATVCLSAAMLWGAEAVFSQAALTLPVAAGAFLFVERRGIALPTMAANGLGLVAIVAAFIEFWLRDIEGRLLFGAHLLVYLSWILLWLPKVPRQRWGLIALSVLQVGVGSVLTNDGLFGLGMAAFLVLAVWTLVLFQLDEAESRHVPAGLPSSASGQADAASLLLGRGGVSPAGGATFGRWPVRQVASAVAVTVAGAVAVGAAFFLLIPRFEVGRHGFEDSTEAPLARQRTTGFTERVRLGEFGQILESSIPVFEVRLFDDAGGEPLNVEEYAVAMGYDEPLFRGVVLTEYESGEWRSGGSAALDTRGLNMRPSQRNRVRQEYRIQPLASETLFAIPPVFGGYAVGTDEPIRARMESRTISRPPSPGRGRRGGGELSYVIFSPSAGDGDAGRGGRPPAWFWNRPGMSGAAAAAYTALPGGLDRLREVAATVARAGGEDAAPGARAGRLVTYLRDSGEFAYSLSGAIDDPGLDPVEDFLVNRKAGHCEYFASGLALMLRSEGIPCRVVSGFKGGEVNRLSGAFEVQQRHAHTWVEAYLDDRWEILDPTPASARNESVAANAATLPLWNEMRSAASGFWRNYVVQMNLSQQRQTLAPIREAVLAVAKAVRENWWPALKRQAYALATDPSRWFSWQGGVATFVLLLLGTGGWRLARAVKLRMARARERRERQRRRGKRVEFYERFRRLCERRGWTPAAGETPREFAAGVAGAIADRSLPARLARLPGELTEDFYRVRFGEIDLSERETQDLGERLGELETALAGRAADGSWLMANG